MKIQVNPADKFDYYDIIDNCKRLLYNSLYNDEEKRSIEANINNMSLDELETFTLHLLNNQIDAINAGHNYQQRDILRKMNNAK